MSSKVPICDRDTLEALPTGSLLSYLRKLQECEEAFSASDCAGHETEPDPGMTGCIEFKNTKEWRSAYSLVKEILARREHIPSALNGNESEVIRGEPGMVIGEDGTEQVV